MISLFKVGMSPDAAQAVSRTLESGYVGEGPKVAEFERMLQDHLRRRAVTVNSATSGLHLALRLLDLPPGSRVLTTPLTCTATNWAILANNLVPEWVDVDRFSLNVNVGDLFYKLKEDTGALMLVHWGGSVPDVSRLHQFQTKYHADYGRTFPVIHDLAHSWGATHRTYPVASQLPEQCVYSFQAIKPLTTGDGGVLVTPFVERARKLRWYGIDRQDRDADVEEWGYKFHMNDVAATVGIANFAMSLRHVERHRENAGWYDSHIDPVEDKIYPIRNSPGSSCWLYTILVERRDDFMRAMKDRGVETAVVHKRNDHYSVVRQYRTELPTLDYVYPRMVCIPVGWWVTDEDRQHILDSVRKGW